MRSQHIGLLLLVIVTIITTWYVMQLEERTLTEQRTQEHIPDYYLEDFTITEFDLDGSAKYELQALYMAHYPHDGNSELLEPYMQIFRQNEVPMHIRSRKGWLTADNEVLLLRGDVDMWQLDAEGKRTLDIDTTDVRVLVEQNYAETDEYARITTDDAIITGTGMKSYLQENRLEIAQHEKTIIQQTSAR